MGLIVHTNLSLLIINLHYQVIYGHYSANANVPAVELCVASTLLIKRVIASAIQVDSCRNTMTVLPPPLEKKKSSAHDIWNIIGFSAFLDRCHDSEQFCHLFFIFVNPKLTDQFVSLQAH
jgi:hypothetical protein